MFPDDVAVVVDDGDGAAPVPQALLDAAVETAAEQEALESWTMGDVGKGAASPGLHPPSAENEARYEAGRRMR